MITALANQIKNRLNSPLPGSQAHLAMIPEIRIPEFLPIPASARKSSVLILLYEKNNEAHFILTLRPSYNGVHSNQVSFPGGKFSVEDLTLDQTALRETEEEIGIKKEGIEIMGALTELYIPPSNFVVTPYIGIITRPFQLRADPVEVVEIFEVPLNAIFQKDIIKSKKITIQNGAAFVTPYFDLCDQTVWGATAMILSEFRMMMLGESFGV
jgi:8-oxo-dGTP pyrophosphatase MutT (NUDIX family)